MPSAGNWGSELTMPKLAAFPKAFMDALCVNGSMTILQWVRLAATLDIDGLEFYAGFLGLQDSRNVSDARKAADDCGLEIPMFCCSPDFTHPDPTFRVAQVQQEQRWIDMAAALGASYCRVLSGQARPEVSREAGLR